MALSGSLTSTVDKNSSASLGSGANPKTYPQTATGSPDARCAARCPPRQPECSTTPLSTNTLISARAWVTPVLRIRPARKPSCGEVKKRTSS
nr:hypothetical protein [Phytohabitans rumicis]